ncbi:hypothetical protein STEG23_022497 [Scotinomys teguina]
MSGNQLFDRKMREGKEKVMARKEGVVAVHCLIENYSEILIDVATGGSSNSNPKTFRFLKNSETEFVKYRTIAGPTCKSTQKIPTN